MTVTGLLLHSVDKNPKLGLSSYPKYKFEKLLDHIKLYDIKTTTVSEHASLTSSPKTTAITFDDGLLSFYDNAYPLLEEKNIKSTIFAVAGFAGKIGDWDVMGRTAHMTAGMLREIASTGHEIGSHSLTHANLVWLDDGELMKELRESKMTLEDITGLAVRSLSFPFGSWNTRVWEAAKSAGYEHAAAYRGHRRAASAGMLPVLGVYRFDSAIDIVDRVSPSASLSLISSITSTRATALMMSHFSKGTPICKFRKEYYKRFPR
jgi:peptidoglycan/xylan/chitin deacetylase (PgdA/CDA1 family)